MYLSGEILPWENVRSHQIPHTAVTVTNIHYFHNDKKQQIPSEGLWEHQYLEQKDLQYLTHLYSLGESSPLGKTTQE